MTKNQTETLALKAADANTDVKAMTVAELERIDYTAKRNAAQDYARNAATNIDGKWADAFRAAYADRVMQIWGSKVKQLDNARRAFKTALTGLTMDQATEKIKALAMSFNFRGARVDGHGLEINRGDRDGAHLYWRFERTDGEVVNPDDPTQRVNFYTLTLNISTCGTNYSPARMALVHKIHGELLEAANEIEATFARERIVSIWGIPEPVPASGYTPAETVVS